MTEVNQIYKCNVCGNVVEVLHNGAPNLHCCNQPMDLLEEITEKEKEGNEKHFPVVKINSDNTFLISVGSVHHPMEDEHFIEWVQIITDDNKTEKQFLKPGEAPEATFCVESKVKEIRSYCNVHGLWKISL